MEPLLFGTIGASIIFAKLQPSTIPKSIAIVLTGAPHPWLLRPPSQRSCRLDCCAVDNCMDNTLGL
jgi:hypothetical protein